MGDNTNMNEFVNKISLLPFPPKVRKGMALEYKFF